MRVLVTGSSGLVGEALLPALAAAGHETRVLVRSGADPPRGRFHWDPEGSDLDRRALEGVDGVVHLAGESIARGRWSEERKQRIRSSRVAGTALLAGTLAALERKPSVLVSASATGYYGDRGDTPLEEDAAPGAGFLAGVCREWEAAAQPARAAGIRVVHPRTGIVLARHGGALAKMLPPFRLGLGGRVGSGRQWWSWITLADLVGVLLALLEDARLSGPVNAVSPAPVTNAEFTAALGQALGRPAFFPLPAPLARLALGEMADALLLCSARVVPARLAAVGHRFASPLVGPALASVLAGPA